MFLVILRDLLLTSKKILICQLICPKNLSIYKQSSDIKIAYYINCAQTNLVYFNEFLIPRIFINILEFFIEAKVEGHKKLFQIQLTTNYNIYVIIYIIILKVVHFTSKGMKRRFLMEPPIPGCALFWCTRLDRHSIAIVLTIKKISPLHKADLC